MSALHCRCGAFVVDELVHLEDTPDGWYAVTAEPVADHVHECRCGRDIAVSSTRPAAHHPAQIRLIGAA